MAITLGSITLPSGLIWSDELKWTPVTQSSEFSLTGALIINEAVKLKGRPITLTGQSDGNDSTAWITRADIDTLLAALNTVGATFVLTLHDARVFTVVPVFKDSSPLDVAALAVCKNFLPANPTTDHIYKFLELRLMEI